MDNRTRHIWTGLAVLALLAAAIGMGSASSTQPLKLLALLGGIGVVYVCLFHRWWGVILLLGMAPFYGFIRYVLDIPPSWALYKEGMVILIVTGWLVEDVVLRRKQYAQNPLMLPLGVFLFVLLVQFLRAPDPVQAVFGLRVYVTYVPIFYVLLTEQPDDRQVKAALGVIIAATHAILSDPAVDRLKNCPATEVIVTNTLPIPQERHFDKLTVLSIAPLVSRAIREVFEDGSVTSLFDEQ